MATHDIFMIAGIDPVMQSTNHDFIDDRTCGTTTADGDDIFLAELVSLFDGTKSAEDDNEGAHPLSFEKIVITMVPNPLKDQEDITLPAPLPPVSLVPTCKDIAVTGVARTKNCRVVTPSRLEGGLVIECPRNPKKRRLTSAPSAAADTQDTELHYEDMEEEAKRERNRCHARKSRQRKKSITDRLKKSLDELKAENAKLREQMYIAIGQDKTDSLVSTKLASPTEKFVATLKNPENRALDSKAVEFFQRLRKKNAFCANSSQNKSLHIVA
eukprot:CAMPEP_0117000668 /NCGR_PEP_ID=MMETSP0472-20121206/2930_1 /TAXON_ID=693140 ORGANISM="Tiarina fusus, Strain LIS" /NCGR_SAMPLE_ID=MMETSP0472 /ASSEMBLY_ACC=CAM_ASM_000603 /LENGTH=270 /DNA_ID=CAMNT_0004700431 /DNA_START=202 /DNA_END=1014 /DNA_ORIENTATION=+